MHSFAKKKCYAFKFVLDEIQTRGLFGVIFCFVGIVGTEETCGVSRILTLVCPALMFLVGKTVIEIVPYMIFCVGFLVPLAFLSGAFNKRGVNLYTKGIKGAQQPIQFGTIIMSFACLVIMLLTGLCNVYVSEMACAIIWLVVGMAMLLLRNKIIEMIWNKFEGKRYAISASFRKGYRF